jgi:hypothetical protein
MIAMTTTARSNVNRPQRKTLASQLDRLDGILDGLDAALAGAVQEAVERAVRQAVQTVLREVLSNPEVQGQRPPAAQSADSTEAKAGTEKGRLRRLWAATTEKMHRTVQTVKDVSGRLGQRLWLALLAAGGLVSGVVYAACKRLTPATSVVYRRGKTLLGKAGTVLVRL